LFKWENLAATTDEMHLLPEPLFVLPTDSLQTRTLAGTDNGRSVLLLAGLRIRIRIILSC
jgi:hypothetical protein